MRAVIVSDTHLGTVSGRDLLRHADARAALVERARGADQVILLGDVVELREAPLAPALATAEPFFRELGEAIGSARLTLVPGNHDHRLAAPLVESVRLEGGAAALTRERSEPVPATGPLTRIAGWLGDAELRLAYPGVWVRPDVYATHGHYLDCHLAIPSFERLAIAVTERVIGRPAGARTPADYEQAVQPLYDLTYGFAQASHGDRRLLGAGRSVAAWEQLSGTDGPTRLGARVLSGVVVPGAVGVLNRIGLGPFTADLSGASLRRSGLSAMSAVAANLGVDAGHVLFGHTHRSGPWPGDDPGEWELAGGGRLVNTGSWVYEPAFLGRSPTESPYWPGTVAIVEDDGPPRVERLLEALPAALRSGP